jgi:hypothetical protein
MPHHVSSYLRHNFHFVQGIVVGSVKLYDINVSVGKLSMDIVDARCFDHPPLFTIYIKRFAFYEPEQFR